MSLSKTVLPLLFAVCGIFAAEKNVSSASAASSSASEELAIRQAASGFAPNTGKEAVINRIKAMFISNAKPIVSTRKFVPVPAYLKMTEIPSSDPHIPPRTVIVYRCRFVDVDKVMDSVETGVGDAGTIEVSQTQNIVVINVESSKAQAVKEMLLAVDTPLPQVLVESQIIEIQVDNGEQRDVSMKYSKTNAETGTTDEYGFNLTSPSQTVSTGTSAGFNFFPVSTKSSDGSITNLNLALRWLTTSSNAKILASPNIIADLGTEAKMETGEDLPYTENAVTSSAVSQSIKFKRTGVQLTIKPTLVNQDTVQLEIKPQVTMAVRYETFETEGTAGSTIKNNIPVVSVRNVKTRLTAADGEIIMLGGLYSSESSEELRKTPYLSDLPLVGELFTAKSLAIKDKQLLFLMKIHILPSPYTTMSDIEHSASAINEVANAVRNSRNIFPKISLPSKPFQFRFDQMFAPDRQTGVSWLDEFLKDGPPPEAGVPGYEPEFGPKRKTSAKETVK